MMKRFIVSLGLRPVDWLLMITIVIVMWSRFAADHAIPSPDSSAVTVSRTIKQISKHQKMLDAAVDDVEHRTRELLANLQTLSASTQPSSVVLHNAQARLEELIAETQRRVKDKIAAIRGDVEDARQKLLSAAH